MLDYYAPALVEYFGYIEALTPCSSGIVHYCMFDPQLTYLRFGNILLWLTYFGLVLGSDCGAEDLTTLRYLCVV